MKFIKLGLVAAALMAVSGVSLAQQKDIKIVDPRESPYVLSPNGVVVMNPFGLCWRTGFWSCRARRNHQDRRRAVPELDTRMRMRSCADEAPGLRAATAATTATRTASRRRQPPPAPPAPTSEKVTFAADALFDFDKATLRPEGRAKLDDLVSKLAGVSLEVIIAVGYTDRIGSDAYNLKLSQKSRAGG